MKIQYPGVAESIPSDIANLSRFIRVMGTALLSPSKGISSFDLINCPIGFIPQSMFRDLDSAIEVARAELMWETDYKREAKNQMVLPSIPFILLIFFVPSLSDSENS